MAVFQAVPAAGRKDGRTFDVPRIAWDTSSESKIAPRGGYSRVRRLPDGSYVAAFEDRRGNVNFSRSADMVTWSKGITVIPAFVVRSADRDVRVNVANAEHCFAVAITGRPRKTYILIPSSWRGVRTAVSPGPNRPYCMRRDRVSGMVAGSLLSCSFRTAGCRSISLTRILTGNRMSRKFPCLSPVTEAGHGAGRR